MSYKIQCDKCGQVLMKGTGDSKCFMSVGGHMECRNCGTSILFTEELLLKSHHEKNDEPPKGVKFEV